MPPGSEGARRAWVSDHGGPLPERWKIALHDRRQFNDLLRHIVELLFSGTLSVGSLVFLSPRNPPASLAIQLARPASGVWNS